MRAREHRERRVRVRECAQIGGDRFEHRQQHRSARLAKRDSVREIVDVLGRAREMDEFRDARDFRHVRELLLKPVLHGLDVVIRRPLDRLDARRIGSRERRRDRRDARLRGIGERGHLGDRRLGRQREQPRELDADAVANQREFAELVAQRIDLVRIPAVERRQRGQAGDFGGVHVACESSESITRRPPPGAFGGSPML